MSVNDIIYSVFTKPWKDMPAPDLGKFVKELGFDGIEYPLREGYQVNIEKAEKELPEFARCMHDCGIKVTSIAGPTDEKTFSACAKAGIPIMRVMFRVDRNIGYMASEKQAFSELEQLSRLSEKYGVKVGVQNHSGNFVSTNSMGLRHLIENFDPRYIGAIWDAAHNALNGENPELGLDIVWEYLYMVNLKNALWLRTNGPEAVTAEWKNYYTAGNQGLASYPKIVKYLKNRNYNGVICVTAEYSAEDQVNRLVKEDIAYIKKLFNEIE